MKRRRGEDSPALYFWGVHNQILYVNQVLRETTALSLWLKISDSVVSSIL
jgi:hypothetical protein